MTNKDHNFECLGVQYKAKDSMKGTRQGGARNLRLGGWVILGSVILFYPPRTKDSQLVLCQGEGADEGF